MTPTYHIVSHSHWDREWYKTFEQFRPMLVNMVDDLIDLLQRDPTYRCFTLDGQTVILEDYLAVRPEREAQLRSLVREGRLVIGPWYILPDEFLVSGEATVRNLLHGQEDSRRFGASMDVGYIPDSFGHIAMMPAILKGFGIPTALVYRGFGGEPDQRSSEYRWHAPDGTTCLMVHLFRHGYSAGYFHQESDEEIIARFRGLKEEVDGRAVTSHRLIMNGGDHHWPDPRLPQTLDLLRKHYDGQFVHSTVPAYVEAVRREAGDVTEVHGELRFGYRYAFAVLGGVYSSRMYLKQANWRTQLLLQRYAEPLNCLGVLSGMRSQLPLVHHAWRTLLKNHPHDSICGCSIDPVHREMMTRFKAVEDIGAGVIDAGLEQLIPLDDREAGDDRHLYFFNPSAFERTETASALAHFYLQDIVVGLNPDVTVAPKRKPVKGFGLYDDKGAEVPVQVISRAEEYDITYSKYNYPRQTYAERFSVLVDASGIPPMGYRGFTVRKKPAFTKFPSRLKSSPRSIENDFLRVAVTSHGELVITDTSIGRQIRGLHVFEDTGDVGDEYNYSYPRRDRRVVSTRGSVRVTRVERGPLRVALKIRMVMRVPRECTPDRRGRSTTLVDLPITTVVSLTASSRAVSCETTVENTARDHRLRVLFASGIRTESVMADSPFSVVRRTQKKHNTRAFTIEHPAAVAPMQRFVAVADDRTSFTLLTEGLPEYELLPGGKGTLALTLLRCVGLLAGEDLITRPGGKAGWHNETPDAQCPGTHVFRYALLPIPAEEFTAGETLLRECERFHVPLLPVRRKNAVPVPPADSFFSCSNEALALSAFKEAEDGRGVILRFSNTCERPLEARVRFRRPVASAALARLDETPQSPLDIEGGTAIVLSAKPSGIVTVRLTFKDTP